MLLKPCYKAAKKAAGRFWHRCFRAMIDAAASSSRDHQLCKQRGPLLTSLDKKPSEQLSAGICIPDCRIDISLAAVWAGARRLSVTHLRARQTVPLTHLWLTSYYRQPASSMLQCSVVFVQFHTHARTHAHIVTDTGLFSNEGPERPFVHMRAADDVSIVWLYTSVLYVTRKNLNMITSSNFYQVIYYVTLVWLHPYVIGKDVKTIFCFDFTRFSPKFWYQRSRKWVQTMSVVCACDSQGLYLHRGYHGYVVCCTNIRLGVYILRAINFPQRIFSLWPELTCHVVTKQSGVRFQWRNFTWQFCTECTSTALYSAFVKKKFCRYE